MKEGGIDSLITGDRFMRLWITVNEIGMTGDEEESEQTKMSISFFSSSFFFLSVSFKITPFLPYAKKIRSLKSTQ